MCLFSLYTVQLRSHCRPSLTHVFLLLSFTSFFSVFVRLWRYYQLNCKIAFFSTYLECVYFTTTQFIQRILKLQILSVCLTSAMHWLKEEKSPFDGYCWIFRKLWAESLISAAKTLILVARSAFEPASETGLEGKAAPERVTGIALWGWDCLYRGQGHLQIQIHCHSCRCWRHPSSSRSSTGRGSGRPVEAEAVPEAPVSMKDLGIKATVRLHQLQPSPNQHQFLLSLPLPDFQPRQPLDQWGSYKSPQHTAADVEPASGGPKEGFRLPGEEEASAPEIPTDLSRIS